LFRVFVNIWPDFTCAVVNVDSLACDLGIVIDGWITVTECVASFCCLAYIHIQVPELLQLYTQWLKCIQNVAARQVGKSV